MKTDEVCDRPLHPFGCALPSLTFVVAGGITEFSTFQHFPPQFFISFALPG